MTSALALSCEGAANDATGGRMRLLTVPPEILTYLALPVTSHDVGVAGILMFSTLNSFGDVILYLTLSLTVEPFGYVQSLSKMRLSETISPSKSMRAPCSESTKIR